MSGNWAAELILLVISTMSCTLQRYQSLNFRFWSSTISKRMKCRALVVKFCGKYQLNFFLTINHDLFIQQLFQKYWYYQNFWISYWEYWYLKMHQYAITSWKFDQAFDILNCRQNSEYLKQNMQAIERRNWWEHESEIEKRSRKTGTVHFYAQQLKRAYRQLPANHQIENSKTQIVKMVIHLFYMYSSSRKKISNKVWCLQS